MKLYLVGDEADDQFFIWAPDQYEALRLWRESWSPFGDRPRIWEIPTEQPETPRVLQWGVNVREL